jgi:hypothetical protein
VLSEAAAVVVITLLQKEAVGVVVQFVLFGALAGHFLQQEQLTYKTYNKHKKTKLQNPTYVGFFLFKLNNRKTYMT